jgi:hypothetical protein
MLARAQDLAERRHLEREVMHPARPNRSRSPPISARQW